MPDFLPPIPPTWCRARTRDVHRALDAVMLVRPKPMSRNTANSGVLRVEIADGVAYVHVQDRAGLATRSTFPVHDASGPVAFTIAETSLDALRRLPDGVVRFELLQDGKEHVLTYAVGAVLGRTLTIHPLISSSLSAGLGHWLDDADRIVGRLPCGVLRVALDAVRPFLPGDKKAPFVPPAFCSVMTFDESRPEWACGNGFLFAGDRAVAAYLRCAALKDVHFAVPRTVLPAVVRFLGRATGQLVVRRNQVRTAMTNSAGDVLSWLTPPTLERFVYPSRTRDQTVLWVPTATALRALQLAGAHVGHNGGAGSIRITYAATRHELRFDFVGRATSSVGMPVPVLRGEGTAADFSYGVDADRILHAVQHVRTPELQLRVAPVPAEETGKRAGAMITTVEEFSIDDDGRLVAVGTTGSHTCIVSRFLPAVTPSGDSKADGEACADDEGQSDVAIEFPEAGSDALVLEDQTASRTESLVQWFLSNGLLTDVVVSYCAGVNNPRVLSEVFDYLDWIRDEVDGASFRPDERREIQQELSGYVSRMLANTSR